MSMGRGRDARGGNRLVKRFFLFLLGLAGLGVGVWLFRSRRRKGRST